MLRNLLQILLSATFLCSWSVSVLEAASIERSDFSVDAVEIDFDSLPQGPLTTELSDLGVVFSNTKVIARAWAPSQPNQIEVISGGVMRASFSPEVLRVGLTIDTDAMHPPVYLSAYDAVGNLLEAVEFTAPGDFAGMEIPSGVAYVEFGPADGYDNLVFDVLPNPVPVSAPAISMQLLLLVALMMVVVGAYRVRNHEFAR